MRYVLRKLGFYLVAAWVALTVNFFLPQLIPGNPVFAQWNQVFGSNPRYIQLGVKLRF